MLWCGDKDVLMVEVIVLGDVLGVLLVLCGILDGWFDSCDVCEKSFLVVVFYDGYFVM